MIRIIIVFKLTESCACVRACVCVCAPQRLKLPLFHILFKHDHIHGKHFEKLKVLKTENLKCSLNSLIKTMMMQLVTVILKCALGSQ